VLSVLLQSKANSQLISAIPAYFNPSAYSQKFTDAFSVSANPASLVSYEVFTAGIRVDQKYLLAGIKHYVLAAGFPVGKDGIGLLLNHLALGAYHQSEIGIGYAKKLGQVDLGVKFNYHKISVPAYGKAAALIIDIGSIWHIADNLHAGVHLYNPTNAKAGRSGERVGYFHKIGLGYEVSEQVLISAELTKEEGKPVNLNAGFHYQPAPQFIVQAGIATANAQPYGGFGIQWRTWRIMMNVNYHNQLGFSPALSFSYLSKKSVSR
jgi:hypothetical protein